MKKIIKLTLLMLLCVAANGSAQKVRFTPRWIPQAQFVGYYVAQELGYYSEVGLEVEFKHPAASVNALQMLKRGDTDLIGCSLSDAIVARSDGYPLTHLMQLFQRSALLIVADRPLHHDLTQLAGLRVARWRAGHSVVAVVALKDVGVEWVDFLSGVNLYLSGAVDATLAMSYNEYISIQSTGRKIEPEQVVNLAEVGYNVLEDGLYGSAPYVAMNKETVEKFRTATTQGWLWAHSNPEKALDIVMEYVQRYKIPTNRYHQQKMLEETLKLCYPIGKSEVSFVLQQEDFDFAHKIIWDAQYMVTPVSYESFILK